MSEMDPQIPVTPDVGDYGTPEDIISKTVVLKLVNKKRMFYRSDFSTYLSVLLEDVDVLGFGSIGRNDTWHLILSNRAAKTRVMMAGDFYIDQTWVKVAALGNEEFQARVHWAPMHIPMGQITIPMEKYATVLSARWDKSPKSFWGHATTLVRTLVLRGDMENIPHLMEVGVGSYRTTVLITIPGRKPVCLRCKKVGHIRSDCHEDYCRHCKDYGHRTEACVRPKTAPAYSKVVAGAPQDLSSHDDMQNAASAGQESRKEETLPATVPESRKAETEPDKDVQDSQESVVFTCAQRPGVETQSSGGDQTHPDDIDQLDKEGFTVVRRKGESRGGSHGGFHESRRGFGGGFGRGRGAEQTKRKNEEEEEVDSKQRKGISSGKFHTLGDMVDEGLGQFSDTESESSVMNWGTEGWKESWK